MATLRPLSEIVNQYHEDCCDPRSGCSLAAERLAAAMAAELDPTPATYSDVEKAFINEAVTVSQRDGQVGVCVDFWVPIKNIGQMRTLERIIKAMGE